MELVSDLRVKLLLELQSDYLGDSENGVERLNCKGAE